MNKLKDKLRMCNIYVFHEKIFDSIKNVVELSSR